MRWRRSARARRRVRARSGGALQSRAGLGAAAGRRRAGGRAARPGSCARSSCGARGIVPCAAHRARGRRRAWGSACRNASAIGLSISANTLRSAGPEALAAGRAARSRARPDGPTRSSRARESARSALVWSLVGHQNPVAVAVGPRELGQHEAVKAVALAAGGGRTGVASRRPGWGGSRSPAGPRPAAARSTARPAARSRPARPRGQQPPAQRS